MASILRIALLALALTSPAFADALALRPRIEAQSTAITLGDVFANAGAAAARPIAPAPSPGQTTSLSTEFLTAAVQSAGLDWQAPPGLAAVQIVRPGGARATIGAPGPGIAHAGASPSTNALLVRRGDIVSVTFEMPGLRLATRARALDSGGEGARVRFATLQTERTIEATVTGAGTARAE